MRTESVYILLALGLALGEQANRIFGNGVYWIKVPKRDRRARRLSVSDAASEAGVDGGHGDNYLEKLVTEYEIIPLMSKLI